MARETIKASEKSLNDVFCDKYVFRIPAYQRPYAWTTEEAGELFDDIRSMVGDTTGDIEELSPYFLGSIVLIKDSARPEADVVDGQQRLTTLTIVLAVMRDMEAETNRDHIDKYLAQRGNPFEGTQDLQRLTLRDRDAAFFRRTIQNMGATHELEPVLERQSSPFRIIENAKCLKDRASRLTGDERRRLVSYLIRRCYLVVVEASDAESAYRVFSVMNNRGMDLSPTDILKADVIGAIDVADREKYTDVWEGLEEDLGRERFRELFAHIRLIYKKQKMRGSLEQEFRESVQPAKAPRQFIDERLEPLARAFLAISNQDFASATHAEAINRHLRHLALLDNIDWEAPAMLFMQRQRKEPARIGAFLCDLDRLAFGLFVTRADINKRVVRYAELISAIEADAALHQPGTPLQLTPSEQAHARAVLDDALYEYVRVRLPVLLRLDEALSDGSASYDHKTVSVEHVLPQKPPAGSVWLQWFPDGAEREWWTHRLGNLVLLSRAKNAQASNWDFERKKREYFVRNGSCPFALTTQVLSETIWTPEIVAARQQRLVTTLIDLWRLNEGA